MQRNIANHSTSISPYIVSPDEQRKIEQFLAEYPYVSPVYLQARPHIEEFFPNARLFAEVVTDPEIPDDIQLVIFIAPELPPLEALERLNQFNRAWGFKAVDLTKGKLFITIQYREADK